MFDVVDPETTKQFSDRNTANLSYLVWDIGNVTPLHSYPIEYTGGGLVSICR